MPDAKDNAKMTGDTHPPEVESEILPMHEGSGGALGADGTPSDRGRWSRRRDQGQPENGALPAGEPNDRDRPAVDRE